METNSKKQTENGPQMRGAIWQALGFAWDFGIVVVLPLAALGIGGRLLDKHYGTSPWIFLAAVVISIFLSVFLLVVRLKKIIAKVTSASKKQ